MPPFVRTVVGLAVFCLVALPLPAVAGESYSPYEKLPAADHVFDVNASGVYVGMSLEWRQPDYTNRWYPLAIRAGEVIYLGLDGGIAGGRALAINDEGVIAGYHIYRNRIDCGPDGPSHSDAPYRWTIDGGATALPTMGCGGRASDIAEDGTIVGYLVPSGYRDSGVDDNVAVRWSPSEAGYHVLWNGWVDGISDNGSVVWGTRRRLADDRLVEEEVVGDGDGDNLQVLPPSHSVVDVNAKGAWALNTYVNGGGGAVRAPDGTLEYLELPEGTSSSARAYASDINDDGSVVGYTADHSSTAAVLWKTPSQPVVLPVDSVPERGPNAATARNFGPDGAIVGTAAEFAKKGDDYEVVWIGPVVWNPTGAQTPGEEPGAGQLEYAALGDSFSSGVGTGDIFDGERVDEDTDPCYRTSYSYGYRLFDEVAPERTELAYAACGSARIRHLLTDSQYPESSHDLATSPSVPQIDHLGDETDLVTLTIGGNDVGFAAIVSYCGATAACDEKFAKAGDGTDPIEANIEALYGDLYDAYRRIRDQAPSASVFVLGYPHLFSDPSSACLWYDASVFDAGEVEYLQDATDLLNATIEKAAADAGVHFVDVANSWAGNESHGICGSDVFINPPRLSYTADSMHPNRAGHDAYLQVIGEKKPLSLPQNPDPRPRQSDPEQGAQTFKIGFITGNTETEPDDDELVAKFDVAEGVVCRFGPRCQFGVRVQGSSGDDWSAYVYSDPLLVGSGAVEEDGSFEFDVDNLKLPAGHHTLVIEIEGADSTEIVVHEFVVEPQDTPSPVLDVDDHTMSAESGGEATLELATEPVRDDATYTVIEPPAHGTASITANVLTFTADAGYTGTDQLAYRARSGSDTSDVGTVTIDIVAPNEPPVVTTSTVEVAHGTATRVTLAARDPEGSSLSWTLTSPSEHGTIAGELPDIVYTPQTGFSGTDRIRFVVSDGVHDVEGTVELTVGEPAGDGDSECANPRADLTNVQSGLSTVTGPRRRVYRRAASNLERLLRDRAWTSDSALSDRYGHEAFKNLGRTVRRLRPVRNDDLVSTAVADITHAARCLLVNERARHRTDRRSIWSDRQVEALLRRADAIAARRPALAVGKYRRGWKHLTSRSKRH